MRGMRALRNFKPDRCYHLISRIANRAFYLTDEERTRFVERLWRVAKFSGIEVLAYCFMSNHFHLLVHLPEAPELRAALGISSVNFFTARDLTPLAKAGYIAAVDTENLHSPQRKYRLVAKGRRLVS